MTTFYLARSQARGLIMRLEAKGWRYSKCETQFQSKCNNWVFWQLFILVYLGALRHLCYQDWGCCLLAAPWFVRAALRSEEGWPGNKSQLLLGSLLVWALLFWVFISLLPYQLMTGLMTQLPSTNSHIPTSRWFFSISLPHLLWIILTDLYLPLTQSQNLPLATWAVSQALL